MNSYKNLYTRLFLGLVTIMLTSTYIAEGSSDVAKRTKFAKKSSQGIGVPVPNITNLSDEEFEGLLNEFKNYRKRISDILENKLKPFVLIPQRQEPVYAYFSIGDKMENVFSGPLTSANFKNFTQSQIEAGMNEILSLYFTLFLATFDLIKNRSQKRLTLLKIALPKKEIQLLKLLTEIDPQSLQLRSIQLKTDCTTAEDYLNLQNLERDLTNYEKNITDCLNTHKKNAATFCTNKIKESFENLPFMWRMTEIRKQFLDAQDLDTPIKRNALIAKIKMTMNRIHDIAQQDAFEKLDRLAKAIIELFKDENIHEIKEAIRSMKPENHLFSFYANHPGRISTPNVVKDPLFTLLTREQQTNITAQLKSAKPALKAKPVILPLTPPNSGSDSEEDEFSKKPVLQIKPMIPAPVEAQETSRPRKLNVDRLKVFGTPQTTSAPALKLVVPTISAKPATPVEEEEEETVTVLPSIKDRLKIFNAPATTTRPQPIVKPVPVVPIQAQQASSKSGKLNPDRFKAFGVPKTDMSGADQ